MRRHLAVTGLALLVLLNIVLVYLAVQNGRGDAPPASEASGADSDQGSGTPSGGSGASEAGDGGSDSNGGSDSDEPSAESIATLADMSGDLLIWGPAAPCEPGAGEITLHRATPGGDAASFTVEGLTGLRAITV